MNLKKSSELKKSIQTYTHTGEKLLKYKNKLHKRSSPSSLANFLGSFPFLCFFFRLVFYFVCMENLSSSKVSAQPVINFLVHFFIRRCAHSARHKKCTKVMTSSADRSPERIFVQLFFYWTMYFHRVKILLSENKCLVCFPISSRT